MPRTKENSLMPSRSRARSLAVLACFVGAGAVPVVATAPATASNTTASASGYTASAAASCSFSARKKGGYFQSLKVTNISCATGRSNARAHDACRLKKGPKGYCKTVRSYRCTEKRVSSSVELNSRVTCVRGSKKFIYTYSQDIA